jgi:hypothetical protein
MWSEVTGAIYMRITPNSAVAPAFVQNIDGRGAFPEPAGMPIKVEPGARTLTLAAAPLGSGWRGGTGLVAMNVTLAPCMRVYINAQYTNPLSARWQPFVAHEEKIAGCRVVDGAAKS